MDVLESCHTRSLSSWHQAASCANVWVFRHEEGQQPSASALPSRPSSWPLASRAGLWVWTLSWKTHGASGLALAEGNSLGGGTGRHVRQPTLPSMTSGHGKEGSGSFDPKAARSNLSDLRLSMQLYSQPSHAGLAGSAPFHRLFGPRGGWGW